jgi:uncharacterized membrane protein YeaQ/YmgE (transglycosylase-associated protein family)
VQRLKEKPYYTRIALLGIAMYLFIEVVILIVTLIFEPSEWAYACIVGGIAGALAAVIYFVRPWGLIVGVLFGLLGIAFAIEVSATISLRRTRSSTSRTGQFLALRRQFSSSLAAPPA